MKVEGPWLRDPACQKVFTILQDGGFEAFVVGGAVRDAAMGLPVGDVDFATNATPDHLSELAKGQGVQVVPTGLAHGTLTLVVGGQPYEVTTYRRDVDTDGRRAVVAFAEDIRTDAKRRDFTINALYADRDGLVQDPLGGWPDVQARRIRFIDDASARIREDALRILRFFRFFAWFGVASDGIDPDGLAACAELADLVDGLSAERIGQEMRKLLSAPDPSMALASMGTSGVLARVAPGAAPAVVPPLVALEGEVGPRWIRRLMAMNVGASAYNWRFSRAEMKAMDRLAKALDGAEPVAARAFRHGADAALDAALITASLTGQPPDPALPDDIRRGAAAQFPLKAADLMPPLKPGPRLGRELARLREDWIASDFRLTKPELLHRLTD